MDDGFVLRDEIKPGEQYGGVWIVRFEDGSEHELNMRKENNIFFYASQQRQKYGSPVKYKRLTPNCQGKAASGSESGPQGEP